MFVAQEASEIASKERVQAWAELDQVKQQLATARTPVSPRGVFRQGSDTTAKLRELQQQLADKDAKYNHTYSQYQVISHGWNCTESIQCCFMAILLEIGGL